MTRVRAPELVGRGGWLNTDRALTLHADLRGKIVLLDFWTFCCINCLHVLDELRPLEEKYADVLVTVGVHSPKFVHEADHGAVVAAVERYAVHHPVLDDPDLTTWKAYAVRAWPTLALVDPEGYVVAQFSGEGHAHALDRHIADLVAEHEAKGTLHRGHGPYAPPQPAPSTLRFPAKLVRLDNGTLLVADAGHDEVVELEADGETVRRTVHRLPRTERARAAPDRRRPTGGVRRRRRGHRAPRAARHPAGRRRCDHSGRHGCAVDASRPVQRAGNESAAVFALGRCVVRRPGRDRDGRHPSAVVVRPDRADGGRARRHDQRGAA